QSSAAAEPVDVDAFRFAVDAPNQTRVVRIIFRMDRRRRTERDKITGIRVRLRSAVDKIDIHLSNEVVFLLLAGRKEKLFPNRDVVGGVLAFDSAVCFATQNEFVDRWRDWLIEHRADRWKIFRIKSDAVIPLADLV